MAVKNKILAILKGILLTLVCFGLFAFVFAIFLIVYYSLYSSFDDLIPSYDDIFSSVIVISLAIMFVTLLAFIGKRYERKWREKRAISEIVKKRKEEERIRFVESSIFNEEGHIESYNTHFFKIRFFSTDRALIEAPSIIERWAPHLKSTISSKVHSMDDELFEYRVRDWPIGVCAKPDAIIRSQDKYLIIEYKSYPELDMHQLELAQLQNVVSSLVFAFNKKIDVCHLISLVRVNWGCHNFEDLTNTPKLILYYLYLVGKNKHVFSKHFTLQNDLISATNLSLIIYLGEANEQNNLTVHYDDRQLKGDIHHCKMACNRVLSDDLFNI